MYLLGRRDADDPAGAGEMPRASARLLAANVPGTGTDPLPADGREEAAEGLRRLVAEQLRRLEALRREAGDSVVLRRRAVDAALADVSEAEQLRHRYAMAHDRSLRATINQLMALERSGADLAEVSEAEPDPEVDTGDASTEPAPSEGATADAPGSLGAGDLGPVPTRACAPIRGPKAPISVPERAGGGGSFR
jgi:hypothetical protein